MSAAIRSCSPGCSRTPRSCRSASIRPAAWSAISTEGDALFDDGKPSEATNNILKFCEEFELSAQRTVAFMKELKDGGLLMDGEVSIQPTGAEQPFVYRGFQMINEEKLRGLEGDELKRMNQNGMLPLILAHLFSLSLVRDSSPSRCSRARGRQIPGIAAPAGNA